jgi:hypothetical protein
MSIGLPPREWSSFAALSNRLPGLPALPSIGRSRCLKLALAGLGFATVAGLVIGVGSWKAASNATEQQPARLIASAEPDTGSPAGAAVPTQASSLVPTVAASVDGLKIVSQRWRRAGLGSKALFTFTLRNSNDYAVRDIAISCAFSRGDGSHLTDRSRVIHETVKTGGRKTFAGVHVGFVNVNAERAKCAPIAAARI